MSAHLSLVAVARHLWFCALPGCGAPVKSEGAYCSPQHRAEAAAPYVVRGGVGGVMYLASAPSVRGYAWVISLKDARRFLLEEYAAPVAEKVGGRVERLEAVDSVSQGDVVPFPRGRS